MIITPQEKLTVTYEGDEIIFGGRYNEQTFAVGEGWTQAEVLDFVVNDARIEVCADCDWVADADRESVEFASNGDVACQGCFDNAFNYASTVWLVPAHGESERFLVTDYGVYEAEYLERVDAAGIERGYVHSSGWRGYFETRVDGYTEVTAGWTTGDWGDAISERKQSFNEWAQALIEGEQECPFDVAIVFDPTSNVFSTAIGVWVDTRQAEDFDAWLNGHRDVLEEALA